MTASLFLCCFRSQIITPFVLHQMKCVCINIIFEMKPYADLREFFYDVSISSLQTNPHGWFILGRRGLENLQCNQHQHLQQQGTKKIMKVKKKRMIWKLGFCVNSHSLLFSSSFN
ncbi:hypothetical protein AAC387_Pa09g0604 [Persea americana]